MENEIWLPIKGHENTHEISNFGNVRSKGYWVDFGNQKRFVTPKIRKRQLHTTGYYFLAITNSSGNKFVHRLVAEHFIPNPDKKPFVNHKDGNKLNPHYNNLEWSTRQENEDHALATGLKNSSGENNTMAKLTEDNIHLAKVLHSTGMSFRQIGIKLNVTGHTISRALRGKTWKHIKV